VFADRYQATHVPSRDRCTAAVLHAIVCYHSSVSHNHADHIPVLNIICSKGEERLYLYTVYVRWYIHLYMQFVTRCISWDTAQCSPTFN
jgi:hypothetical protein